MESSDPALPRTVVAFPGVARFAQQAALAFLEVGALDRYTATFVFREDGALAKLISAFPGGTASRVLAQLRRRSLSDLHGARIETQPFWEVLRTAAEKAGAGPVMTDRIWDAGSYAFTKALAGRIGDAGAVYAYEYTALEAFERASHLGVGKILDLPSLNSREYEALQAEQVRRFPELASRHDGYFAGKFEARQARRDQEVKLADVIITNSSLTRRSHIAGGADPERTFAIPYGAPATLADPNAFAPDPSRPLRAVWAGTFSIRKGAPHVLDAWRKLDPGAATLDTYGAIGVPTRLLENAPADVRFRGSIPQSQLLEAFGQADVLVFPTLSDGFGMVVTEAFSRGLPVITTDQAGAADLVEHGKNGLIVPAGDVVALADALRWCLDNRDRLADMRFAAVETARRWQWSDYRRSLRQAVATGLAGVQGSAA
jgi:glycosyltransferase involved in cell wall biosynthesis